MAIDSLSRHDMTNRDYGKWESDLQGIYRFDGYCVGTTERLCRWCEKFTGKSNYYWLKILTGFYSLFLLLWILIFERYGIGVQSLHNFSLLLVAAWFFYISFIYCDGELERARDRVHFLEKNPSILHKKIIALRLSVLVSAVATTGFCIWVAIVFNVPLYAYLIFAPFCISPIVFWLCLLLDACDPLPVPTKPAIN